MPKSKGDVQKNIYKNIEEGDTEGKAIETRFNKETRGKSGKFSGTGNKNH